MRIIGGYARGIRLSAPDGLSLRPTEDRVKETVFSMLGDISGMTVADLFSGTGAMGLEALSRRAACVKSIELNPLHADFIQRNYEAVAKSMGENLPHGAFQLIRGDVSQFPSLLLADPPYHQPDGVFGGAELVASRDWPRLAAEGCILVLEHAARMPFDWFPKSCWKLIQTKIFGKRAVSFAKLVSPP